MQAFSRTLVELYRLAEDAPLRAFPEECLRLLQPWVRFDGAVFGMGEGRFGSASDLCIVQAHVHNRSQALLEDYAQVSAEDPVTGKFLAGLDSPLVVDCQAFYRAHGCGELDAYTERHDMRHLMLFGDAPTANSDGRWLVLYRGVGAGFMAQEAEYLHAAWLHIARAVDINRAAVLDRHDRQRRAARACAMVNARGGIEAADPAFLALIEQDWPGHSTRFLPRVLFERLQKDGWFRGRDFEVRLERYDGYWLCVARQVGKLGLLSPKEIAVAQRFAAGRSTKDIAREFDVSANTVRNQLSSAYAKLGVHDKASLALLLQSP